MFVSNVGEAIRKLSAAGVRPTMIAVRLGVADNTVRYHLARIEGSNRNRSSAKSSAPRAVAERSSGPERGASVARAAPPTRQSVASLLAEGSREPRSRGSSGSRRELGITKATVSYHARRLGAPATIAATGATTGSRSRPSTTRDTPWANAQPDSASRARAGSTRSRAETSAHDHRPCPSSSCWSDAVTGAI